MIRRSPAEGKIAVKELEEVEELTGLESRLSNWTV